MTKSSPLHVKTKSEDVVISNEVLLHVSIEKVTCYCCSSIK